MTRKLKDISFLLSQPVITLLIFLGFIPVFFAAGSTLEGRWFPVVENVQVTVLQQTAQGILINSHFDKIRSCEFVGVSWYDRTGDRIVLIFEDDGEFVPASRPVLDDQQSGPWVLVGLTDIKNSTAIATHICHPLWLTYTKFYPRENPDGSKALKIPE